MPNMDMPISDSRTGKESIEFSIIIPARNEERVLPLCLEHLAAVDFPAAAFEVILVDNGSTDRTIEIFRSWQDRLRVRVLEKPGVHIAAVRNAGVAIAHGELLGFLDADCLVPRDWLKNAARFLSDRGADIVGAHYRIPPDSTWVARAWFDDAHANVRGSAAYVPSGDLLLSRAIFHRIGGFNESLETNEDFEFCQRAKRAGLAVSSFPELEVIHLGTPQKLAAFYGKQRWHGRHVFRVFLENLPSLYNARAVFFALYVFLGLAGVLAGAIAVGFTGKPIFLLAGLGFILLGPLVLAFRAALQRGEAWAFAPLVLLFLLFGIARASCLLSWRQWSSGREQPRRQTSPTTSN